MVLRTIHYELRLHDGALFDSTIVRDQAVQVDTDSCQFPARVVDALTRLSPGENITLRLSPEEGYGYRDDELTFTVTQSKLPPEFSPSVGGVIRFEVNQEEILVTIVAIEGDVITLDGNHPLADQSVTFYLEILA